MNISYVCNWQGASISSREVQRNQLLFLTFWRNASSFSHLWHMPSLIKSRFQVFYHPKSNIDTKHDVFFFFFNMHLLSNMAILGIHVSFRGCKQGNQKFQCTKTFKFQQTYHNSGPKCKNLQNPIFYKSQTSLNPSSKPHTGHTGHPLFSTNNHGLLTTPRDTKLHGQLCTVEHVFGATRDVGSTMDPKHHCALIDVSKQGWWSDLMFKS